MSARRNKLSVDSVHSEISWAAHKPAGDPDQLERALAAGKTTRDDIAAFLKAKKREATRSRRSRRADDDDDGTPWFITFVWLEPGAKALIRDLECLSCVGAQISLGERCDRSSYATFGA
jgi:hypothetical protein